MTENDRQAFYDIMDAVNDLTVMPNGKDLERLKLILFQELMSYPLSVIAEAMMAYCRSNRFFPMLADIITQIEGTADDRAIIAWSLVMKARQKYKMRKSIRFPVPAIHFAIEKMGGWERFYWSVDDDSEIFKSSEFQKLYKIGEKCASWNDEKGKVKVCPYFKSYEENYALQKGRKFRREVYDVETDKLIINETVKQLNS